MGYAILESYSRILETLAFTVLSRIEDVMSADAQAKGSANIEKTKSIKEETDSKPLVDGTETNTEQQGEADGKKANDEN